MLSKRIFQRWSENGMYRNQFRSFVLNIIDVIVSTLHSLIIQQHVKYSWIILIIYTSTMLIRFPRNHSEKRLVWRKYSKWGQNLQWTCTVYIGIWLLLHKYFRNSYIWYSYSCQPLPFSKWTETTGDVWRGVTNSSIRWNKLQKQYFWVCWTSFKWIVRANTKLGHNSKTSDCWCADYRNK